MKKTCVLTEICCALLAFTLSGLVWCLWHIIKQISHRSHKKRIVWKHGRLNRNLYVMLKFTEWSKTPGMTSKKQCFSWRSLEISSFAGDLVLMWMKQRLIWFNLQKDKTRNWFSNIKETFTKNLQLKMSVLCTKVWPFSKAGLSSSYYGWAK